MLISGKLANRATVENSHSARVPPRARIRKTLTFCSESRPRSDREQNLSIPFMRRRAGGVSPMRIFTMGARLRHQLPRILSADANAAAGAGGGGEALGRGADRQCVEHRALRRKGDRLGGAAAPDANPERVS